MSSEYDHLVESALSWRRTISGTRALHRPRTRSPRRIIEKETRCPYQEPREVQVHGKSVLDLPAELLHAIFDHVDKLTILTARLSCRTMARIGAEHILDTVQAVFKRDSLEKIAEIARNSAIARSVKCIHFHANRFGPAPDFHKWHMLRRDQTHSYACKTLNKLLDRSPHDEQTSEGQRAFDYAYEKLVTLLRGQPNMVSPGPAFRQYQATVADQASIVEERLDFQCFRQIFEACQNLTEVKVSIGFGAFGYTTTLLNAFKELGVMPTGDIDSMVQGVDQFWTVLNALYHADRRPTRFCVSDVSGRVLTNVWGDNETEPLVENLMRERREFRISFDLHHDSCDDMTEDSEQDYNRDMLAEWFSNATHLRVLKICMWDEAAEEEDLSGYPRMEDVLGTTTWPRLRELGLSRFSVAEDYLVNLLLRHRGSLRRLSLCSLDLVQGSWESFFARIAGQLPKLRKVKLRGCFADQPGPRYAFEFNDRYRHEGVGLCVHGERDAIESQLLSDGKNTEYWLKFSRMLQKEAEDYKPPSRVDEPDAGYTTDGSEISYGSDDFDDWSFS